MDYKKQAEAMSDEIIGWRRALHTMPELELDLPQTKQYIKSELEKMGIIVQEFADSSSMVALIGKKQGKTLAIRCDIDGLPVKEETGLSYASMNGNMHACGHDAHGAIGLGIAKILKNREEELNGQVKILFQAGEEPLTGAKRMVADGVLENPKVDRVLVVHVGRLCASAPLGDIVIPVKNAFLASETIEIEITGKGGHAATPHLCVDPVVIASKVILELQTLISREVKPGTVALISLTSLSTSSDAYNIIPDSVLIKGGIRAEELQTQEFLFQRVQKLVEEIAEENGAVGQFRRISGAPPVINDAQVVKELLASAAKILPQNKIHTMESVNVGADDASYFMQDVPGCYFFLCNGKSDENGMLYPHHNSRFQIDDSVLYEAVAIMAQAADDYLTQNN